MQKKDLSYDLDTDVYRLLVAEPFFCALSRRVHKVPSLDLPTAGGANHRAGKVRDAL